MLARAVSVPTTPSAPPGRRPRTPAELADLASAPGGASHDPAGPAHAPPEGGRPGLWIPHTLVLLLGMVALALVATWLLPPGAFTRVADSHGHEVVVPGTYTPTPDHPRPSPLLLLLAIPRGLAESRDIIFFVFLIGGALAVIRATGTIDGLLAATLRRFRGRPRALLTTIMVVFAAGSSTLGMAEEYIPFVPVLAALCLAMGLDVVAAIGALVVGYCIGYGVAAFNPFTVVVAQQIAGLPPTSGLGFRLALFIPMVAIGVHHVLRYAARVTADPRASLVHDVRPPAGLADASRMDTQLGATHLAIVALTIATLGVIVWGIKEHGWYLEEMGACFLALTLAAALVGRLHPDRAAVAFTEGAAELTTTALLIGVARAIQLVLIEGQVIDTIVQGVATPLAGLGGAGAAIGMYLIQSLTNLFIPSGSGQAYVMMPIMAPIADITGVSRQTAVLAFQFGDGFTNMLVPTNAVLVGILGMAGIPFDRWFRFALPLMVKLWIAGSIALAIAVAIGY
jgi:uncharacterized ion transporter superfamily protein YfcC